MTPAFEDYLLDEKVSWITRETIIMVMLKNYAHETKYFWRDKKIALRRNNNICIYDATMCIYE